MLTGNFFSKVAAFVMLSFLIISSTQAGELQILAASGIKKPLNAVIAAYKQKTGQQVNAGYGNMQQVLAQAKAAGQVALVIGDEKALKNEANFFVGFQPLGQGQLVIAWAQNSPAISKPQDLTRSEIARIAFPDGKGAIYGIAATEWMKSNQLEQTLQGKLIQTATVAQVSSYLVAKEVNAGFINLTEAIGLADKIGGYLPLTSGYSKITLVAGSVKGQEHSAEAKSFLEFMTSEQAKQIFKQYGM